MQRDRAWAWEVGSIHAGTIAAHHGSRERRSSLVARLLATTSGAIALVTAAAASAQVATPPTGQADVPSATAPANNAAPSARDQAATVGEIVVTARQRTENLQNTPFSITAVGAEKLQNLNVRSTMDLDNKVPGLVLRPDNNRLQPFIAVRGVGDISRNPGIDTRTGIYLDGVPLGRSTSVNYPIYDVESVEVLRGPQGTLFGNNSLTGVINIVSQKPTLSDSSRITVSAGSRNLFAGSGYLNAALADNLAVRVTLAGQSQDGWYKNRFNGSTIGGGTNFSGRLQVRWNPTPSTRVDFSADAVSAKDDILLGVGQFTTGPSVGLPRFVVNQNYQPTRDRAIYGTALSIEQKLPRDFTLTSISSYRTSRDRLTYDGDGTPLSMIDVNFKYTDWSLSQELRVASPQYKYFDYIVGLFYYHDNPGEVEAIRFGPDHPAAAARGAVIGGGGRVASDQEAIYGHGTFRPFEWLAIDGGLRFQNTTKAAFKTQANTALVLGYPAYTGHLSLEESSVDPLVSVTIKPFRGISLYALYSTGDRSGGFNIDVVTSLSGVQFNAESVNNYEVGVKSQLFGNRLRLNASSYLEKFKDFQQAQNIVDPNPAPGTVARIISVISNAAQVKSEGVEADFDAALLPGLHLSGGVGFNHAVFESFKNGGGPGVDYTGNRLIEAPRFQAALVASYDHELTPEFDGRVAVNYSYRSHVFSQPANNRAPVFDNRYQEDGFGQVGLRLSAIDRKRNLELAFFVKNLFDETHVDGAAPDAAGYLLKQLSEPRTLGVELTLRR